MAPLIPLALQLAQFAPSIMRFFGAEEASAAVAEKVVDVAQAVTRAHTPEDAISALSENASLRFNFNLEISKISAELEKLRLEDLKEARKRDIVIKQLGQVNLRANLLTLGAFIIVFTITYLIWTNPEVNEYVKGTATLLLGRFLGYMDQIFQFEFGAIRDKETP